MKKFALIALAASAMTLSACSSDQVIDNTAGVVGGTTRLAGQAVVGTGKLVYRGGQAVLGSER